MRIVIFRTVLVWMIVWPLVTGILILLGLLANDLALVVQTLVLTAILVPLISLWLAPAMQRLATHLLKGKQ
ncbi:hypothetical protein [Qipengyuania qiaonensis]|uniref:DUF4175 domain-containing protein n=1 Tax=Qipengyuania qiaonensis TaxID=2867240 RepID=A0ABS7JCT6_9SPHN|nr:hypothetical protein [Qipengyuania qiaonensis]MBX7483493.1 hypothetical protein [Qipengyuania qiaonensis]